MTTLTRAPASSTVRSPLERFRDGPGVLARDEEAQALGVRTGLLRDDEHPQRVQFGPSRLFSVVACGRTADQLQGLPLRRRTSASCWS